MLDDFEDPSSFLSQMSNGKTESNPLEEINYSAAAAAERWTAGMEWDELVDRTRAEQGDLVRLFSRTGEALRQLGKPTRFKSDRRLDRSCSGRNHPSRTCPIGFEYCSSGHL